jgi:hypothetical protein
MASQPHATNHLCPRQSCQWYPRSGAGVFRVTEDRHNRAVFTLSAARLPSTSEGPMALRPDLTAGLPLSRMRGLQADYYQRKPFDARCRKRAGTGPTVPVIVSGRSPGTLETYVEFAPRQIRNLNVFSRMAQSSSIRWASRALNLAKSTTYALAAPGATDAISVASPRRFPL